MIVYSGSVDSLVVEWRQHGALGKSARWAWDGGGGNMSWSYAAFQAKFNTELNKYGGKISQQAASLIEIQFNDPADYTLFCLRLI